MGVVSLCLFMITYAWAARSLTWPASLLCGWLAFAVGTAACAALPALREATWATGLLAAFTALTLTQRLLPRLPPAIGGRRPRHDLAIRMGATALLVVGLTSVAGLLGPGLSGLVTPFPVATTILVVFAHREAGASGVMAVYGGFLPSLYSFAAFCAAISFGLARWPPRTAFLLALLVSLAAQSLVLLLVGRKGATHPNPSGAA